MYKLSQILRLHEDSEDDVICNEAIERIAALEADLKQAPAASISGVKTFAELFRDSYQRHEGVARKVCAELRIGCKKFYNTRELLLPTLPFVAEDQEEL